MNIAICGPGGCGKDTIAALFAKHFSLTYIHSTSYTAAPFVRQRFADIGKYYKNLGECYDDRRNHRQFWADAIDVYNAVNKTALYAHHLESGQQIATGIRKLEEIRACKAINLFDLIIWIERPGYMNNDQTQQFNAGECDITILNDDPTLTDRRIERLALAFQNT